MKFLLAFAIMIFLIAFWSGMYYTANEATVLDTSFAQALEVEAEIPSTNFNQQTAKEITELDLSGYALTNIDGIEHFTSLETLILSDNLLTSVDGIEQLTNLVSLDVSFNELTELKLSSPMIEDINIENNRLTEIDFAEGLTQLHTLNIRDNNIEELTALNNSDSLVNLNARGNRIMSIDVLSGIETLKDVNLRNNQIKDTVPLRSLVQLTERLYLTGNGIVDYTPLADLAPNILDKDFDVKAAPPLFSIEGGIIAPGSSLTLESSNSNAEIYYTVDGSLPTVQSTRYQSSIVLNEELKNQGAVLANINTSPNTAAYQFDAATVKKGIVIRASTYEAGEMSETITQTYLLNEVSPTLPVIALSVDPDSLFSEEEGIYVPGMYFNRMQLAEESNYNKRGSEWERLAHVEYFEPDNERTLSQNIGLRIHGGVTRNYPQKSLRMYSKSEYGQSRFYYPFFENHSVEEFNQLTLRNSGNDWNSTMFRDALIQELVADRPIDTQAYKPAVVLINGEYWGLHNLRESFNAEYIEIKYNLDAAEIVLLESDSEEDSGFSIEEGSLGDDVHYNEMLAYANANDLRQSQHLAHMEQQLDLENYLNYMAIQIFIGNTDSGTNNTALWRKNVEFTEGGPYGSDGRWRWMLFDTDFGFARYEEQNMQNHNTLRWALRDDESTVLFRSLMQNETVQSKFQTIMNEMIEGPFNTPNVLEKINDLEAQIAPEMPTHLERWKSLSSTEVWESEVNRLRAFAEQRPDIVKEQLNEVINSLP